MEQTYILRRNKEESDYRRLQNDALETLQALSGNIWTDFNAHDPGVSITEVLHYALLELQHILQLPFETFLTSENEINFEKSGLYSSQEVSTPSIVTLFDYENLIKSSVSEILDCKITLSDDNKYNIKLTINSDQDFDELKHKVETLYHANRNLCETLGEISFEVNDQITKKQNKNSNPLIPDFESTTNIKTPINNFYSEYDSVQNHFPDCYGVNEKGICGNVTTERKAQVMQMKAYLLIFDFLLSNTHHQINNIVKLFNLSDNGINPYSLNFSIKDMGKLIDDEKFADCAFENAEYIDTQKSHILDMLEVLYGEETKKIFAAKSNKNRVDFLSLLPRLSADRFKSFNILQRDSTPNIMQLIKMLRSKSQLFYIIEHILLGGNYDDHNTLTIAIPGWSKCKEEPMFESFLREQLPAHLNVKLWWIEAEQAYRFDYNYFKWREALAIGNDMEKDNLSKIIRKSLSDIRHGYEDTNTTTKASIPQPTNRHKGSQSSTYEPSAANLQRAEYTTPNRH